MRRVVVLGSTGSIGTQTLDVVAQFPDRLKLVGLAAGRNGAVLKEQAALLGVSRYALYEGTSDIPHGMNAIVDLATMAEADIVVISVAGVIGLLPTIEAIKAGKDIALASKEVLVAAGELVMPLVREHGVSMRPIDSEHSAIFQCLEGAPRDPGTSALSSGAIDSLILTASGGPFRGKKRSDLENVTVQQALNHPTWNMGGKITIDSATLMNKGLETIEARWLFDVEVDRVKTVVHPQSIVHSFVKFADGSVLGQLGWPDMRLPIAYALLYPERLPNKLKPWDALDSPSLTFEDVDHETFPSIQIAKQSIRVGGTLPCVMNAANEEAANAFLRGEVRFLQIPEIVQRAMSDHRSKEPSLENLIAADEDARRFARNLISTLN